MNKKLLVLLPAKLGTRAALLLGVLAFSVIDAHGQFLTNEEFFSPDARVRRPGQDGTLTGTTDLLTPNQYTETHSSGDVSWTLGVKGLVQAGIDLAFIITVDAQLYSYVQIVDGSLVFGRHLDTEFSILGLGIDPQGYINDAVNDALSLEVLNSWSAVATISNQSFVEGERYSLTLDAHSSNGLPVGLLEGAAIRLLDQNDNAIALSGGGSLLNLLDLITIGSDPANVGLNLEFDAPAGLTELKVEISAATAAGINLFGGASNTTVLTFDNFALGPAAVPEPTTVLSGMLGLMFCLRRKRD